MKMPPLACLLALSLSSMAQQVVTFPKILEGSGHTCFGHLWHTDKTLYWKEVYSSCRSPYTVVSHDGSRWLLKVNKSKSCAFELIEITNPVPDSFWYATVFYKASDLNRPNSGDYDSCTMYDVTPAALDRARKELAQSKAKNP